MDDHAFGDGIDAGWQEMIVAFYFNDTHAAGADLVDAFPVAEAWHWMAGDLCSFEDGQAGWNTELYAVYCDVYHFVCLPPLKMP